MKGWVAWSVGGALVAAAWGVALVTPSEDASEEPFAVHVEVGERGVGRNIAVTVQDVRRAESVTAGEWSARGDWVIVDLDAEAVVSEFGTLLELATLDVGGRVFRASERPESLLRSSLAVGIPRTGSLAFELPPGLPDDSAVLRLSENSDPRLDSVIVVEVVLDQVDREPDAELRPTGWSAE